jgi:hypothetical protein
MNIEAIKTVDAGLLSNRRKRIASRSNEKKSQARSMIRVFYEWFDAKQKSGLVSEVTSARNTQQA